VATVEDGIVTAVGEGRTEITVRTVDGDKTDRCSVIVKFLPVESVRLNRESLNLYVGAQIVLEAVVQPDNADKALKWTSSDDAVVTIEDGLVKAIKEGQAEVTVTTNDGSKKASCRVNVIEKSHDHRISRVTATTVSLSGELSIHADDLSGTEVTLYYSDSDVLNIETANAVEIPLVDKQSYNVVIDGLKFATEYKYAIVVSMNSEEFDYGVQTFTTLDVKSEVSSGLSKKTATTAKVFVEIKNIMPEDEDALEIGIAYSKDIDKMKCVAPVSVTNNTKVYRTLTNLDFDTEFFYCSYIKQGDEVYYGKIQEFKTDKVTILPESVNHSKWTTSLKGLSVNINFSVDGIQSVDKEFLKFGLAYDDYPYSNPLYLAENGKVSYRTLDSKGNCQVSLSDLHYDNPRYYYCPFIKQNDEYFFADEIRELHTGMSKIDMSKAVDLSAEESANCYIHKGQVAKFKAVKGNSNESVGEVAYVKVLWESDCHAYSASNVYCGCIIKSVYYADDYVAYERGDRPGNAVIAAYDKFDTILWSWHIWAPSTDPTYPNDTYYKYGYFDGEFTDEVATLMSGYLGAQHQADYHLSVDHRGHYGLIYYQGDRQPRLRENVRSTSNKAYRVQYGYSGKWDGKNKTIHDPCPPGWRIPDGEAFYKTTDYTGVQEKINYENDYCLYTYQVGPSSTAEYMTDFSGQMDDHLPVMLFDTYYVCLWHGDWSVSPGRTTGYVRCMKE